MHPRGELKRELVVWLRHHNLVRKPRSQGNDHHNQIADMRSIHIRPPEIEDRLILGHWESDLIKGAGNRSSVGTLVERATGFVVLSKMNNANMPKTMTYDYGSEMHGHKILTERTGV